MTRKIIIFIKCVTARNYLVDFRESSEIYSYLPDVYVFLQSMSKYHQIKKNDAVSEPHHQHKKFK